MVRFMRAIRVGLACKSVGCILLGLSLTGCGTSQYSAFCLNARVEQLRSAAAFSGLYGPTQLTDTPVKIRVPTIFGKSYTEASDHKQDGGKISPDRVQPPFLPIPGFKICYEGTANDPGGNSLPFYCYLGAVPGQAGDGEKLGAKLQETLKQKFPSTPETWDEVDCRTPNGTNEHWRKIRVVGDQSFRVLGAQKAEPKDMPGIFELWIL